MTSNNVFAKLNAETDKSIDYSDSALYVSNESEESISGAKDRHNPYDASDLEKRRNTTSRSCSNCGTSLTSTWRNLGDQIVCNACKCFYRKHGKNRPIHMRKDSITSRNRKTCKLSVPNEVVFKMMDAPNQNSLEIDSGAVAEIMCLLLQYLKDP